MDCIRKFERHAKDQGQYLPSSQYVSFANLERVQGQTYVPSAPQAQGQRAGC
jgi:hypothetical protein